MSATDSTLGVLLGASEFGTPAFQDSEAFKNSHQAFKDYLCDEAGLALNSDSVFDSFDSGNEASEIIKQLDKWLEGHIATAAKDIIIYYTGHGGFRKTSTDYFLAIRATNEGLEYDTSIKPQSLANVLEKRASSVRVHLIIDACFSGAFAGNFQSDEISAALKKQNEQTWKDVPTKGTAILCSSSKNDVSLLDEDYTMFSQALIDALRRGDPKIVSDRLTVRQLSDLTWANLKTRYGEDAVRPELHVPRQPEGDISDSVELFPNLAAVKVTVAKLAPFTLNGKATCCVIEPELELTDPSLSPLGKIVEQMLDANKVDISSELGEIPLETQPWVANVTDAVLSRENLCETVKALCRSEIAIFDVTAFEPGVMLLLGIRSVVRRGVTVLTVRDRHDDEMPELPFLIRESSLTTHKLGNDENGESPYDRLAWKLREGLSHMRAYPHYQDLPSFHSVRRISSDKRYRKMVDYEKMVLFLCSFSDFYTQNNWEKYLRDGLTTKVQSKTNKKTSVLRTLDVRSPRLVSQTLFEAIRLTRMCIIDWTEWRPNVFFELGVRLASSRIMPIVIIDNDKTREPSAKASHHIPRQTEAFWKLFQPISYDRYDPKLFEKIILRHEKLTAFRPDDELSLVELFNDWIDATQEFAVDSIHDFLKATADELSAPDVQSESVSSLLFPGNKDSIRLSEKWALESRLAAWYYLHYRYDLEEIVADKRLWENYIDLGTPASQGLLEEDEERAKFIREQVSRLKKRLRENKNGSNNS